MKHTQLAAAVTLALTPACMAQSLYTMVPPPPPPGTEGRGIDGAASLQGVSMFAVQPPRPQTFKQHDLVTIIVDESSRQNAEQSLKTDKKYNIDAELGAMIDPMELLEARLRAGDTTDLKLIEAAFKSKFDGQGEYERNDKLQMKIQATIIDVKPNGVLVLEARKLLDKNGETQSTVLSGLCRQADITQNNSVFSSQLADLTLITKSEGQVDKAGQKGLIPRVLETVFAF